jgi:hypothetical protein
MPATYTYDPTTLDTDSKDRVRRVIGDVGVDGTVSSSTCKFADEEITYTITSKAGDEVAAAVELLEQLATLFADKASVSAGNQKIALSDISKQYAERALRLLGRSNQGNVILDIATTTIDAYSDDVASDDTSVADGSSMTFDWWDV